jgi:lipid A 4'-phosphatase
MKRERGRGPDLMDDGGSAGAAPARSIRRRAPLAGIVLFLALLLASIAIRTAGLDLSVERRFFQPGATPRWWGVDRQPWEALYRYGTFPGLIIGALSLIGIPASLLLRRMRRHLRAFLLLACVLAIGPGLLVNTVCKEHWGRPRPRDIVEFGGNQPFVPVGLPVDRGGHSFPSGHAAMGFYLLTFYILWRKERPAAAAGMLLLGLAAGVLIGIERMAVGAHFPSDVLWAGGIVALVAIAADGWLPAEKPRPGAAERVP